MADASPIEWTDATWNPVRGCTRVSPGCGGPGHAGGCYAEGVAARFSDAGQPYHGFAERGRLGSKWTGRVSLIEAQLDLPLRWKKPRRIFVNSMSDLFHERLSDEAVDKVFAAMAGAPHHTFQVLTKRAERMRAYLSSDRIRERIAAAWCTVGRNLPDCHRGWSREVWTLRSPDGEIVPRRWPLPNVWLGVSVEDQARADERIPALLATPAAVRFLSCEPLLGPVEIPSYWLTGRCPDCGGYPFGHMYDCQDHQCRCEGMGPQRIHWVIAGGESGPKARPMHPDWARGLRDQCAASGVPFFFKQWGEWAPGSALPIEDRLKREEATVLPDGRVREWQPDHPDSRLVATGMASMRRVGKKAAGRLLDGRAHDAFPERA